LSWRAGTVMTRVLAVTQVMTDPARQALVLRPVYFPHEHTFAIVHESARGGCAAGVHRAVRGGTAGAGRKRDRPGDQRPARPAVRTDRRHPGLAPARPPLLPWPPRQPLPTALRHGDARSRVPAR